MGNDPNEGRKRRKSASFCASRTVLNLHPFIYFFRILSSWRLARGAPGPRSSQTLLTPLTPTEWSDASVPKMSPTSNGFGFSRVNQSDALAVTGSSLFLTKPRTPPSFQSKLFFRNLVMLLNRWTLWPSVENKERACDVGNVHIYLDQK